MGTRKRGLALIAIALSLTTSTVALAAETEAVIISRSENTLNVRTREGPLSVVVTPQTTIRETSGLLQRRTRGPETLIPGLIIEVDGDQQGNSITAQSITYKERDWRSAIATRAGTTAELSELRQAIIEGQEYVVREEVTVYFDSGSTAIASAHQLQLRQLAQNAASHGNYRISILGFADSRGDAAANERLSLRRAGAVSNFLRQTGSIEPGRVLSPSAMGEGTTAPGIAPPQNDDEARRVIVRVVTPKTQLTQ
jgi:outer membrane protein OmpA-like peptidoglycan-associated protein